MLIKAKSQDPMIKKIKQKYSEYSKENVKKK